VCVCVRACASVAQMTEQTQTRSNNWGYELSENKLLHVTPLPIYDISASSPKNPALVAGFQNMELLVLSNFAERVVGSECLRDGGVLQNFSVGREGLAGASTWICVSARRILFCFVAEVVCDGVCES